MASGFWLTMSHFSENMYTYIMTKIKNKTKKNKNKFYIVNVSQRVAKRKRINKDWHFNNLVIATKVTWLILQNVWVDTTNMFCSI